MFVGEYSELIFVLSLDPLPRFSSGDVPNELADPLPFHRGIGGGGCWGCIGTYALGWLALRIRNGAAPLRGVGVVADSRDA